MIDVGEEGHFLFFYYFIYENYDPRKTVFFFKRVSCFYDLIWLFTVKLLITFLFLFVIFLFLFTLLFMVHIF